MTSEPAESQLLESASTKSSEKSHSLWWFSLAALIGLLIFFAKDDAVFPHASLDLKLSRAEVIQRSVDWSRKLGYDPDGAIQSTIFAFDSSAKTFLEFELGAQQANQVMKNEVPIWYWRTRFCRESQPEEMRVYVKPTGELQAFSWSLQNDKSLPSVGHKDAQSIAEKFCESIGDSVKDFSLVNDATDTLTSRTDHSFTWEQKGVQIHGARQRISVRVSGNVISRYNHYLRIPEAWENKFKTMRSYNTLLAEIARIFYYLLNCAAVFFFFRAVATHNIRWRLVLALGAMFATAGVLENFNNSARIFEGYSTTQSVRAFLINHYVGVAVSAVRAWILGACFVGAAETFYRVHYLDKIAVEKYFDIKGLSTNQMKVGLWMGFCVGAIALGWVVVYYLFGEKIGVWCPLGLTNYEIISSAFPFFSAICLGLQASISEEILYRVFGLTLARMVVKRFWLANLLQAAAWGFMHSTYPQQPAYARGIELTCSGMMFGYVMNRFGLFPCIAGHYLLDAFLDSQPLLHSPVPVLQASVLLPILPLIIATLLSVYFCRKHLIPNVEASNQSIPKPIPRQHGAPVELPPFQYESISRNKLALLATAIAIALPVGLVLRSSPAVGDGFKVQINREQAVAKARKILLRHGIVADGWQYCAWLDDDISSLEMQYVYEKVGLQRTLELAPQTQTGLMWRVRFFKPQQVDEYEVDMDGSGAEAGFTATQSDEDPAPLISEEQAKTLVENYIDSVDARLADRRFLSASQDLKPARLDYTFSFTIPKYKVGEATYKVNANVQCNQVSGLVQGWVLPDKWKWSRSQKTPRDEAAQQIKTGAAVLVVIVLLWWAFSLLRTGAVHWRVPALLAVPGALLLLLLELNDLPMIYRFYQTIKPMSTFYTEQGVYVLTGLMSKFIELTMGGAFALGVFKMLYPDTNFLSIIRSTFKPKTDEKFNQRRIWLDSIAAAYAVVVCDWLIDCGGFYLQQKFSSDVPLKILSNVCSNANFYIPGLDYVVNAFYKGVNEVFIVAVIVGLYAKFVKRPWMFFVFAFLQSLIINSDQRSLSDLYIQTGTGFLSAILYWIFVVNFARRNVLAYFLAGYATYLFRKIPSLVEHGLPCYAPDLVALILLLLLPIFVTLALLLRGDKTESG